MRALLLLAVVSCSPAWWPVEEHGGLSPRPAAPDVVFIAPGAALDAGLQLAHVAPIPRLVADVSAAVVLRTWKPLGRTEGSHFLFGIGAAVAEFGGVVLRGHP
jgi:hypothetical protein